MMSAYRTRMPRSTKLGVLDCLRLIFVCRVLPVRLDRGLEVLVGWWSSVVQGVCADALRQYGKWISMFTADI